MARGGYAEGATQARRCWQWRIRERPADTERALSRLRASDPFLLACALTKAVPMAYHTATNEYIRQVASGGVDIFRVAARRVR